MGAIRHPTAFCNLPSDKLVPGFLDGMNLILRRDVDSVGRRGDLVQVAPEYARKHLLPKRLAVAANETNRKIVAQEHQAFLRKDAKLKSQAQNLAAQLGDVTISISRVLGPNDVLIGAVTAGDIADALSAHYAVDRRKILLDEPIDAPGEHTVRIGLQRDVTAEIRLVIVAPRESFSAERELLDEATRVFGDEATAREWVDAPIASLGGQKPGELFAGSPSDRQRVETILGRIECGIF